MSDEVFTIESDIRDTFDCEHSPRYMSDSPVRSDTSGGQVCIIRKLPDGLSNRTSDAQSDNIRERDFLRVR